MALVLAPGTKLHRIGLHTSLPVTTPSFALAPPHAFATALLRHLAARHALPRHALASLAVVVVQPSVRFSRAERASVAHAFRRLLRCKNLCFVPAAAAALAAVAQPDGVVVDVGWRQTVVSAASVMRVVPVGVSDVAQRAGAGGVKTCAVRETAGLGEAADVLFDPDDGTFFLRARSGREWEGLRRGGMVT